MTNARRRTAGRAAERVGPGGSSPSGVVGQSPAPSFSRRAAAADTSGTTSVFPHGDGRYEVRDGGLVLGVFDSSAEAWRWIDRHHGEPISPAEKRSDWIVGKILGGAA